eukprot:8363_1
MKSIQYIFTVLATIFVSNIGTIAENSPPLRRRLLPVSLIQKTFEKAVKAITGNPHPQPNTSPPAVFIWEKKKKSNAENVFVERGTMTIQLTRKTGITQEELTISTVLVGEQLNNVATVFATTNAPEKSIVMQYYEHTIADTIAHAQPQEKAEKTQHIIEQVVNGLNELNVVLHKASNPGNRDQVFVHGNLMASNLFMIPGGQVQISGFGSSKMVNVADPQRFHDYVSLCFILGKVDRMHEVDQIIRSKESELTECYPNYRCMCLCVLDANQAVGVVESKERAKN